MAITRLWQSGWEWDDPPDIEITSANYITDNTQFKTGARSLKVPTGVSDAYQLSSAGNLAQSRFGFHFYVSAIAGTTPDLFFLRDGPSTNVFRLRWDAVDNEWDLLCGATIVASYPDTIPLDTWMHFWLDIKIDAAVGWIYLYRDGNLIADFDGQTNQGAASFDRLYLGSTSITQGWTDAWMDDNLWDDTTGEVAPTAVSDRRFTLIRPDTNGNYSQFDGSDGNQVDNYLLVNELPPDSDTSYVTTAIAANRDSYSMDDYTIPSGWTVESVVAMAYARKVDAGGLLNLQLFTRETGVDQDSATLTLGTGYTLFSDRQTTKPSGGAWGQSSVNAVEVGVESV